MVKCKYCFKWINRKASLVFLYLVFFDELISRLLREKRPSDARIALVGRTEERILGSPHQRRLPHNSESELGCFVGLRLQTVCFD
jgi:hypothetical protein